MQFFNKRKVFLVILFLACTNMLALGGCQKKAEAVEVINYNLGQTSFIERETEIPYDIEGMMGIPKEDNAPVVFIIHGSHRLGNGIKNPYYQGFEYLVKELAQQGYLAISINVNRAYSIYPIQGDELLRMNEIFKEHYNKLVLANEGKKIFRYNLKGKANLSKINMIGHSRGGQDITAIIGDQEFKDISFQSALKISAADNFHLRETYTDIPTAIINSQFDGDVVSLDSLNHYYYAYQDDKTRKTPIMSAYLYGADHNSYNTQVIQKELMDYGEVDFIKPKEQREFIKKYVIDFLNIYNKGDQLFNLFNHNIQKRYGIDFMYSVHQPLGKSLIFIDEYMEGIQAKDVDLKYVVSSANSHKNTTEGFNLPGTTDKVPLYKISWNKKGGKLTIPIDGIFYEISPEKILALYMALDSPDKRNSAQKATEFDLMFTDTEGGTVRIPMSSKVNASLKYQSGDMEEFEDGYKQWRYFTPLGSELIPLKQLEGKLIVDNIVSFTIIPTSKEGSIMLGGINLYESN